MGMDFAANRLQMQQKIGREAEGVAARPVVSEGSFG